jgi:hypothetical protein
VYREIARLGLLPSLGRKLQEHAVPPGCSTGSYSTVYSQRDGKATDNTPSPIPVDSTYMKLGLQDEALNGVTPTLATLFTFRTLPLPTRVGTRCQLEILPASTGKLLPALLVPSFSLSLSLSLSPPPRLPLSLPG